MISERRHAILNLIIEHYLRTGEPMGSKTLCQLLPYSISSATIRNEMAYLSELGFLEQRHTSGGRVPSKTSYRYYVDNLMQEKQLSDYDVQKINEMLSVNSGDPERLLADAAKLLAEYSHCASFYCMLEDTYDCIQGIDLIPAGNSKAMLVVLTMGSKIKSSLINMPCIIDDEFRFIFYNVVNKFFIGTPLNEINPALIQNVVGVAGERIFDLLPVLGSLCSLCSEASQTKLSLSGETNLLSHEEFGADVYRLLSFLTEKEQLTSLIKEFTDSNAKRVLFIGDENPLYEMKNTSTIISKYTYGNNQKAAIGVIGSMRIDYENIIPKVKYIMNTVDTLFQKEVQYEQKENANEDLEEQLDEMPAEENTVEEKAEENPLEKELADTKEQLLRVTAEYANFRKRSEKEKNDSYSFATAKAVGEILPTVDNLERALANEQEDYEGLKKGVQMIYDGLMATLGKLGVEACGEPGEQFDPNFHNAVMHVDDDSLEANVITDVFQKGYKINDKVVRPAMVKTAN